MGARAARSRLPNMQRSMPPATGQLRVPEMLQCSVCSRPINLAIIMVVIDVRCMAGCIADIHIQQQPYSAARQATWRIGTRCDICVLCLDMVKSKLHGVRDCSGFEQMPAFRTDMVLCMLYKCVQS